MSSVSEQWRKKGNEVFVSIKEGLSPAVQEERLKKCITYYGNALNYGSSEDEKASAAKNIGVTSWKLAKLEEMNFSKLSMLVYYYRESFKHFSVAYNLGGIAKSATWVDSICESAIHCFECFKIGRVELLDYKTRSGVYHGVAQHIDIQDVKASCYFELATIHFRAGITATQAKDFRTALYELKEASMPLQEAISKGQGIRFEFFVTECNILEEDRRMQLCIAESLQALHTGDQIFNELLNDQEFLNLDMVWEVVDWYKQVVLKTREVTEVELEAIALSRLGRLYDRILKLKYKARIYVKTSIELAASMHPRVFTNDDWYKESTEILERYQKETVEQESEKWNKERKETLEGLKTEMKQLSTKDKELTNHIEFLKFVFKTFPPKNPNHTLDNIAEMKEELPSFKKVLQASIIYYHPDRNMDHGKQWKVMSEEITKVLTRRYELLK